MPLTATDTHVVSDVVAATSSVHEPFVWVEAFAVTVVAADSSVTEGRTVRPLERRRCSETGTPTASSDRIRTP
jgi:hypothetical protein